MGVLTASWLMPLFPALLAPGASSVMLDLRVGRRLIAFTALLATASTVFVGAIPAWRGARMDLVSRLKTQSATTTGTYRGFSLRDLFAVGEIAISGAIVIAAGLLVRTFVLRPMPHRSSMGSNAGSPKSIRRCRS